MDGDPTVEDDISKQVVVGHLAAYDTLDDLRPAVGGEPVLNKIGLIVKERNGVIKKRMILDTNRSNVKASGEQVLCY